LEKLARQIAISDIHGCARTFKKLVLEKVVLDKQDTLFLLGDYINKGPDSKGVLDFIFELKNSGFNVQCLRGNHEQYLIDGLQYSWEEIAFLSRGGKETLESFDAKSIRDIPEKYLDFIRALPYYVELQDNLLIHAGLNFDLADPYKDDFSMLNIHVPMSYTQIERDISNKNDHICLDAGCVYREIKTLKHLVALDINLDKLYIQVNIE
jgi:serine/threonine protein phosphatase 1